MKNINKLNLSYLLFIISSLSLITNVIGKPLNFSSNINNKVGKIVQRYNIDVYKHRVKSVDYLELKNSEDNDDDAIDENITQKTRDYIKILNYNEKNDRYHKKMNSKHDEFDKATDINNLSNVISLSNENIESSQKKDINLFNFQIFCIDSTIEKCEKIKTNLNNVGKSLELQIEIKKPINILVKSLSFCKTMNKDCGAVKTEAITTPTAFYSLRSDINETPYLYPQSLVKQLNIDGEIEYTPFDIQLTINTDINYWYWSDETEIEQEQVDFQHVMAHEILHGMGIISSLSQSFKKDFNYIFNVVSSQKEHPYLLPYFHYGYNGHFNTPVIKEILPLFIFDKYLNIYDKSSNYNIPIWNYLSALYESDKIVDNYVSLAIKKIEDNMDIFEGTSFIYNYALCSQWIFNEDDSTIFQNNNEIKSNITNKYIPIETFVYNEWLDNLSGSHTQCDSIFHVARSKEDGIMCTFINKGEQLFKKNSQLLGKRELTILSSIGWTVYQANDSDTIKTTPEIIKKENYNNNKINETKQSINIYDRIEVINDDDIDNNNKDELFNDLEEYHFKKRDELSSNKKYYFSCV